MESLHAEETGHRGWFHRLHLSWPMLFLIGWVLYELTTQPMLGAVAVCLKYGWEDIRAAIWLRRADSCRLRGRACFWLYLAWGLAKIAGVAGLMSFAFVAASPKGPGAQGPRLQAIMEVAAWTGLTTLAGLVCSMLTFGYAVALARWGGFKLWLSRDIHRARRRKDWPPYGPVVVQDNRLPWLLIGTLFISFIPLLTLFCIALIVASQNNNGLVAEICFGGMLFLFFGWPVLILLLRDRIQRWLVASHPSECWDADASSLPEAEIMAEMFANPLK